MQNSFNVISFVQIPNHVKIKFLTLGNHRKKFKKTNVENQNRIFPIPI